MKWEQIVEGKWYPLFDFGYEECCHCGLTHKIQFSIKDGNLVHRFWIDEAKTKRARKRRGIKIVPSKDAK